MPHFADILLPLALENTLTYGIPTDLQLAVGQRVVVPLGKRKRYTGIVTRLHDEAPAEGVELKYVEEAVDEAPLLLPAQLQLWEWLSNYYICTKGEVLKAALPSGLKLESEMRLIRAESPADVNEMTPLQQAIYHLLDAEKPTTLEDITSKLKRTSIINTVRQMIENGWVEVRETMRESFRARTETYVRLPESVVLEDKIDALFDGLRKGGKPYALLLAYTDLACSAAALRLRNPKLLAEVSRSQLLQRVEGGDAALRALIEKGYLESYSVEVGRLKTCAATETLGMRPLNDHQQRALEQIKTSFEQHDITLLHGVTSSGKTEVYMKLIEDTLAEGKQVLYMLPEIALTTQITTRLGRVFGDKMGVYHSKFPDAERVELWQRQLTDKDFPLILGVRSSLFLPFQNLGLIIVDEEHETSYKQQDPAPRYHARDAALVLAKQLGAKVLLGTATPSLESFYKARQKRYGFVEMRERFGGVELPEIIVEDVKELKRKKMMKTPFSPRLKEEIQAALERKEQAILFLNRRGYSPVFDCHHCGWTPKCTQCDVSLTFHQREQRLVCHYCGKSYDVPRTCPNCHEADLRDIGYGTEKIQAAIEAVFPTARTARMDLDTTRSRAAYEQIIRKFQQGETDILIGTQMLTKGLDFDRVSVVGIINADQLTNMPDFRAHERAFQMLSQVAGRAGRRGKQGKVVMQTRQVEHPLTQQVVTNDYFGMYAEQMQERQLFRYPPFFRVIHIFLKHRDDRTVEAASAYLASLLRPHFPTDLLGPERPLVAKVQMQYIRKFMLKVAPNLQPASIRATLRAARNVVAEHPEFKGLTIYYDVDPL
ncbi:MAG: primosomal protein N' [Bacteroidaceae bacterium]|nr:primosomal protein N' [Bacteroidaceae bacterium]